MKVVYQGPFDARVIDAHDIKSAGVEGSGFSKTTFSRFEAVEVSDDVAEVITGGAFPGMEIVKDEAQELKLDGLDEAQEEAEKATTETGAAATGVDTPSTTTGRTTSRTR